jgi:hypothetical protein
MPQPSQPARRPRATRAPLSPPLAARALAACALAACALAACALAACATQEEAPPPPHTSAALSAALEALAKTCARDPAEGRARLEALTLTRAEVVALLMAEGREGVEALAPPQSPTRRALALAERYATALAPRFVAEGCEELARAERLGWGQVSLDRVGPNQGARNAPGDLALLLALPARPALYTARWHAPHETLGLRVSGFVWAGGRWRALLKLGELLEPWRAEELARAEAGVAISGAAP